MNAQDIVLILSALGLGAAIQQVVVALVQRRKIGADTVAVLTAAAADLVGPLRSELAAERAEVASLRTELAACSSEAHHLRAELAAARVDADALRAGRDRDRRRIRQLEAQLGHS